jgi:uncharacterized protein (DUF488 family)
MERLERERSETKGSAKQTATAKRGAIMCAEAVPRRCHRQLVADALLVRGWSVRHLMDDGCRKHKLPSFATLEGTRIIYRGLL